MATKILSKKYRPFGMKRFIVRRSLNLVVEERDPTEMAVCRTHLDQVSYCYSTSCFLMKESGRIRVFLNRSHFSSAQFCEIWLHCSSFGVLEVISINFNLFMTSGETLHVWAFFSTKVMASFLSKRLRCELTLSLTWKVQNGSS